MKEIRLVEWVDSASMPGWNDVEEVDNHHVSACHSVGFVMRNDETQVLLASSLSDFDNVADVMAIPRVAITAERTLRKATGDDA